jgi:hypothetical protein
VLNCAGDDIFPELNVRKTSYCVLSSFCCGAFSQPPATKSQFGLIFDLTPNPAFVANIMPKQMIRLYRST